MPGFDIIRELLTYVLFGEMRWDEMRWDLTITENLLYIYYNIYK